MMRRLPRPATAQTPLQRACWHLGEAFAAARADRRTFAAFCDIAVERLAKESLRLLNDEWREWRR